MRISKANHLKRLLQTQDVLVGTLCYLVTVDTLWLLGHLDLASVVVHLQLAVFHALICVLASLTRTPKLHSQSVLADAGFAVRYALIVLTGMLAVAYIGHFEFVSRLAVVGTSALIAVALFVNRLFLRWWYFTGRAEHPSNYLKILVIGSGQRARKLIEAYRTQSEWGVDVIGMLDPYPAEQSPKANGMPLLGGVSAIRNLLASQVIDEVVVCVPRSLINDIEEVVKACDEQAICIKFLADIYDMPSGATVQLETIGALPVLSFDPVYHDEGKLILKRIMDLMVTIPALILLAPFFGLVALAIRLDSTGPVFFRQERVGLNKRVFKMIKFRSMYQDAEARMAELEHLNEAEGPIFT